MSRELVEDACCPDYITAARLLCGCGGRPIPIYADEAKFAEAFYVNNVMTEIPYEDGAR